MFSETKVMDNIRQAGIHHYNDVKMLIEEKNFGIEQVLQQAYNQIEMCREVLSSGRSREVQAQSDDGIVTETISSENADEYILQAHFLIVATLVYADLNGRENDVPDHMWDKVSEETMNAFKRQVGLSREDKEGNKSGLDYKVWDKNRVEFVGW